ncbi:MAG: hypothetical protein DHS20C20_16100 [Ardenticatenaceae bacterium]|nr:MAG: hypothetical protein DHS20C20_16100 [Ardenticatenaceae bacterium]
MRERVSLYIYENGRILFFYRVRPDCTHHVAIGGGVDPGETLAEAALREAKEETNFDIELGPQLWKRNFSEQHLEYAYLVTQFSGKLALGGPELARQSPENQYIFQWIPLEDIPQLDLYPGPVTTDKIAKIRTLLP